MIQHWIQKQIKMSKYDKILEEMIVQEETLLGEIYTKKLAHLQREVDVRMGLGDNGFIRIEPEWSYENTPEYIEHQKNGMLIAVEEEKAKVLAALNNIERNKLQREELKSLKEGDNKYD